MKGKKGCDWGCVGKKLQGKEEKKTRKEKKNNKWVKGKMLMEERR